jgi:hypothetical protein
LCCISLRRVQQRSCYLRLEMATWLLLESALKKVAMLMWKTNRSVGFSTTVCFKIHIIHALEILVIHMDKILFNKTASLLIFQGVHVSRFEIMP